MDGDKSIESSQIDAQAAGAVLSASRRRLLRSGLGASPVLLTFASQSVSAAVCKSASATVSANASRANAVATCSGNGVSTWAAATAAAWSSAGYPTSTLFSTYFSPLPSSITPTTTMLAVEQGTSTAPIDKLARAMVAALLNLGSSKIGSGAYDVMTLKNIWTAAANGTGYKPIPGGIIWQTADVINWLNAMFPVT